MLPLRRVLPFVMLAVFGWNAWSVSPRIGVTADETAHLTSGYLYWTARDFRFHPENGALPQRWMALPLLTGKIHPPARDPVAWANADVWKLGRDFFFHSHNDVPGLLASARLMIVALGLVLAVAIYAWARSLFGPTGGLIALGFATFSPTLLAHSGLATSDLAASLGFLLATLTWWRLCHRMTPARGLAAGFAAGLLALAKFSAVLFAPIALLLVVVRLFHPAALPVVCGRRRWVLAGAWRGLALAGAGLGVLIFVAGLIWANFGFRYSAGPTADLNFAKPWSDVLLETPVKARKTPDGATREIKAGIVQHFVRWSREHRLLPEAYVYGLAFADRHARHRLAYFAGDYREDGWREFFPVAFALKSTLPETLAGASGVIAVFLLPAPRRRRVAYRLLPLAGLAAVYWTFSITSHLNIGHRHILPFYPVWWIVTGGCALGLLAPRGKWLATAGVLVLLGWQIVAALTIRPHYLTYFNEAAGGPRAGHRFFVDSSLDWGQGLPELRRWLEAHPEARPVFLSYFGSDDPARLGIQATRLGDIYFDFSERPLLPSLTAGTYSLSATMLHRVYTEVRGPWSPEFEKAYWSLRRALAESDPERHRDYRREQLPVFEQLRFGRLCYFLQTRAPDAVVANSIFIYHLGEPELTAALDAPLELPVMATPAR